MNKKILIALMLLCSIGSTINLEAADKKNNTKENRNIKINEYFTKYCKQNNLDIGISKIKINKYFISNRKSYNTFIKLLNEGNNKELNNIMDSILNKKIIKKTNINEILNDPFVPKGLNSSQVKNYNLKPIQKTNRRNEVIQWAQIDEIVNNFKPKSIVYDHQHYPTYKGYSPDFSYADGYGKPRGVVIHETANHSGHDNARGEVNAMRADYYNDFEHTFVDSKEVIEARDTNLGAWGAGATANKYFIHIEMCEEDDPTNFKQSLSNTAYYAAKMLRKYNLTPSFASGNKNSVQGSIWSHSLVSQLLGGSDHTDPDGYFAKHNFNFKSMYELIKKFYIKYDTKWQKINNNWKLEFGDSTYVKGWFEKNNKWYYFKSDGIMATFDTTINNKEYFFSSDGEQYKNKWRKVNNNWYYYNSKGLKVKSWNQIKNKWYYFKSNGIMATFDTIINNNRYFFSSDGEQYKNKWRKVNNNWYYYNSNGLITKEWKSIKNKWYYFNNNGMMLTHWQKIKDKWYYLDNSGKMLIHWNKIGRRWYWFYGKGHLYNKIGWEKYHNNWMYSNGVNGYSTSEFAKGYWMNASGYYKK